MRNLEIRLKGFRFKDYDAKTGAERRVATKRERILFYSRVFNGEAEDRRANLSDRRQQ